MKGAEASGDGVPLRGAGLKTERTVFSTRLLDS